MLGWAAGFFVAAIVAAMFGFGVVASTFAGVAMILFWVFVGLTVVSLLLSLVSGGVHVAGDGHVSSGPSLGGVGAIVVVAVLAIAAYAWVKNDWTAEQAGRAIDQSAARLTADASDALHGASNRAERLINTTGDQMRNDTAKGLDRAQQAVDSDNHNETDNTRH